MGRSRQAGLRGRPLSRSQDPPAARNGTSGRSSGPRAGSPRPTLGPVREIPGQRSRKNVVNMDPNGRQSVSTFERGTADALVTYENELLLRKKAGKPIPYVIPPSTLLIESPAALVDSNVDAHKNREVARRHS